MSAAVPSSAPKETIPAMVPGQMPVEVANIAREVSNAGTGLLKELAQIVSAYAAPVRDPATAALMSAAPDLFGDRRGA